MKKITDVRIEHQVDDDTYAGDCMGKFAGDLTIKERQENRHYIERCSGILRSANGRRVATYPSGGESIGSREYNLFVLETNHLPYRPKNWAHVSRKDKERTNREYGSIHRAEISYAFADWQRMEALARGAWHYEIICAVATYAVGPSIHSARDNEVRTGWVGGVESDAPSEDYENDLLWELAEYLDELGFSLKEINEHIPNWKGRTRCNSKTPVSWPTRPGRRIQLPSPY